MFPPISSRQKCKNSRIRIWQNIIVLIEKALKACHQVRDYNVGKVRKANAVVPDHLMRLLQHAEDVP